MAERARGELWGLAQGRRSQPDWYGLFGVCALEKSGRKNQLARSKALCALSWNRSRLAAAPGAASLLLLVIGGFGGGAGARRATGSSLKGGGSPRLGMALRRVRARKIRQKKPASAVQSFVRFELESEPPGGCAGRRVFIIAGNWWLWWRRRRAASYGVFAKGGGSPPAWYGSSACARSKNQAEKTS